MAPAKQAAPPTRPGQPDRMPFVLVTAGFWSAFDRFARTTVLVAIAAGIALGGVIVSAASWRCVFVLPGRPCW
ncbi:hypothetical protein [Streptomyces noursei]|uniref:hypothetical protein n=1 Tax=Streptomyces noursei TaxID=1971 RepID=UPI0030F360B5